MAALFRPVLAMLAATFLATACAPVTSQNTAVSLADEQARSQQLVQQMNAKGVLLTDRALNAYVGGIVAGLAQHRAPGSVPLRTFLVKDGDVNAFTSGGGYLFVNAGMLAAMENEAQLATVLAHEIGHIDRGHIQAQAANQQLVQLGGALAQIGAGLAGVDGSLTNLGIQLGQAYASTSFSRDQERDADGSGFALAARAGYNMVEGAQSFVVLQRLYGNQSGPASFFSSHPASGERAQAMAARARAEGAAEGKIGAAEYARAMQGLRQEALEFYTVNGRVREADQIRRNLRG